VLPLALLSTCSRTVLQAALVTPSMERQRVENTPATAAASDQDWVEAMPVVMVFRQVRQRVQAVGRHTPVVRQVSTPLLQVQACLVLPAVLQKKPLLQSPSTKQVPVGGSVEEEYTQAGSQDQPRKGPGIGTMILLYNFSPEPPSGCCCW
jgi:hypothetical protein